MDFRYHPLLIDNFSAGKGCDRRRKRLQYRDRGHSQHYPRDRDWKTTGTEADQATYYKLLFDKLADANKSDGIFHNQLKSFNMWSIIDNPAKAATDEDRYFGLIRLDGRETSRCHRSRCFASLRKRCLRAL